MRTWAITAPLGAVLIAGGIWLGISAQPHFSGIANDIPRHKITDQMVLAAAKFQGESATDFPISPVNGPKTSLSALWAKGPVVLIFILDGCPCSIEAQPFYQSIVNGFEHKVTFVGITNGTPAQAKEWVKHFQVSFPVVSDPSVDIMKAYHAQESTYSALILAGGKICRVWPGYDQAILADMEAQIAQASGLDFPDLNFSQAPIRPTSGCYFYGEPPMPKPSGG